MVTSCVKRPRPAYLSGTNFAGQATDYFEPRELIACGGKVGRPASYASPERSSMPIRS